MRHEVVQCANHRDSWIVQSFGADGEIYRAIFDFADAKRRAEEYAVWMNDRTIDKPSLN